VHWQPSYLAGCETSSFASPVHTGFALFSLWVRTLDFGTLRVGLMLGGLIWTFGRFVTGRWQGPRMATLSAAVLAAADWGQAARFDLGLRVRLDAVLWRGQGAKHDFDDPWIKLTPGVDLEFAERCFGRQRLAV
jgi:hypothetical protein